MRLPHKIDFVETTHRENKRIFTMAYSQNELLQWRCKEHLPSELADFMKNREHDTLFEVYQGGNVCSYVRYRPCEKVSAFVKKNYCSVCAFKSGMDKVANVFYKKRGRRVVNAMWNRWATPRPDGTSGYAEWSWRKMKEELESSGVYFV